MPAQIDFTPTSGPTTPTPTSAAPSTPTPTINFQPDSGALANNAAPVTTPTPASADNSGSAVNNTTSFQGNPVSNAPASIGSTLGSLFHVFFGNNADQAFNPVAGVKHVWNDVLKPIGTLAVGSVAPQAAGGDLAPGQNESDAIVAGQNGAPAAAPVNQSGPANAFANFGANFLGGALQGNLKGALVKANNNPAGFLLDLSQLVDAIPGAQPAADAINPVTDISKVTGKAIDTIGGKIEAPFSGSVNTEAAAAATKLGMDPADLPLSAQTTSKFLQGNEAIASRMIGGNAVRDVVDGARNNVNDFITNTVQQLTPSAMDNTTLGSLIKTGFDKFQDTFETDKNNMYNAFQEQAKDAPAFTSNTESTLQKIIDQEGTSLAPNTGTNYFQSILDKLKGGDSTISGFAQKYNIPMDSITNAGLNPDLTFETLKQTRTDVGNLLHNNLDPFAVGNKARLGQLYSSLSDDMDATVQAVNPALAKQMDAVNDFYRNGINKINSKLGRMIDSSTPEKIVSNFIKPNNATNLQDLSTMVGPDVMGQVGASFLQQNINAATDQDGNFNIKKFQTSISKYDPQSMQALLTPEQGQALTDATAKLNDAQDLQDALKAGVKTAEGSQTAFNQNILSTLTKLAQLGPAAFGLATHNILLTVGSILGEYAFPKFITSDWGKQWLTTGFDTPVGKLVQQYAPYIGRVGNISNINSETNNNQTSAPAADSINFQPAAAAAASTPQSQINFQATQ